jgi:phospholipid transport system substrate-binding protein
MDGVGGSEFKSRRSGSRPGDGSPVAGPRCTFQQVFGIIMLPRCFLPSIVALLLAIVDVHGAPARDATALVDQLVREGLQTLRDERLTPDARQEQFAVILENDFDLPRIARFTAGRHWSTATEVDRQRFVKVFERWIIITYTDRFSTYSGDGIKVTGSRPDSETTATVFSRLVRDAGTAPLKIDWRVRRDQGDDYRVVDVSVEGVSMLVTQREEFASVIQSNGGTVAGLTKALEKRVSGGAASRP